jgi:hypothetical protein
MILTLLNLPQAPFSSSFFLPPPPPPFQQQPPNTTLKTKHPNLDPHQPLMCSRCFRVYWYDLTALHRDPKLPHDARPNSLEILRLVCVTPLPFGHWLPKGPMSYKILIRESVVFVHPSVHPFVRLSVRPSVRHPPLPPMLPYRFPMRIL